MANEFKNLINKDLLSYYNTKVDKREDDKISSLPITNKAEFLKSYFESNSDGKVYGVKFAYDANGVIQASSGVKYGANNGLVVEPSTRTVIGRDDYRSINVFRSIDANVHYGSDGNIVIDAISGEDGFSYYGKVDVVCIFAPVYERIYDKEETVNGVTTKWWHIEWCDRPKEGFTLNILCKGIDGKNQGFYTITKFPSVWIDGAPYSSAGRYPWVNGHISGVAGPSYNNCVDRYHARNENMTAMTHGQVAMIQRIFMMKYGRTRFDQCLNGLISYYKNRLYIQTATTNKSYILLTTTDANSIYADTQIDIGNPTSARAATARSIAANVYVTGKSADIVLFKNIKAGFTISDTNYAIASASEFDILCKKLASTGDAVDLDDNNITMQFVYTDPNASEESTVDINLELNISGTTYTLYAYDSGNNVIGYSASGETTNTVIYIDTAVTVDTTCSIQTAIYKTGYSLGILGKDGSYINGAFNTSGRNPSVMSGIELFNGAWDICGNAVYNYDSNTNLHVLVQNDLRAVTKTTNTITAEYTDAGYFTHTTSGSSYKYGKAVRYDLVNGVYLIDCDGGSSSNGLCDAIYYLGDQKSGFYEVLLFGSLSYGGNAGPFCSSANTALSLASWSFAARAAFVCSVRAS